MKIENALAKIQKAGLSIRQNDRIYYASNGKYTLRLDDQDGRVISIHVSRVNDEADGRTDYFPGSYYKTLIQALRAMQG